MHAQRPGPAITCFLKAFCAKLAPLTDCGGHFGRLPNMCMKFVHYSYDTEIKFQLEVGGGGVCMVVICRGAIGPNVTSLVFILFPLTMFHVTSSLYYIRWMYLVYVE